MTEIDERQMCEALKQSFPPVHAELARDLWPDVLRKLDARPSHVPWYDWALIALSLTLLLVFPRLILVVAYHL